MKPQYIRQCSCGETKHLTQCQYCRQWMCSRHRVGTGSSSDGYTYANDAFEEIMGRRPATIAPSSRDKVRVFDVWWWAAVIFGIAAAQVSMQFMRWLLAH